MCVRFAPGVALPNDPKLREQELDLFRWDDVFRTVIQYYDEYVDVFKSPTPGQPKKPRQLPDIDTELQRLRNQIEADNDVAVNTAKSVGLVTMGLLLPATEKLHNKTLEFEQQFANVQLAFAIQAYRADHARYPAKLDDLAPKYVKTLPLDLFSNKPLTYQPKDSGYLLYSVGPNRHDDGGLTFTDTPKGDDLRVQIPNKEDK